MTDTLEFADIQGNILTAYGRLGFPKARYLVFNVGNAAAGRALVEALRHRVTTALRWPSTRRDVPVGNNPVTRPKVAINLAFTFRGLLALGVPTRTLRGMPDDFIDGMLARAPVLGDDVLDNTPEHWDPVWQPDQPSVHILLTLNAQAGPDGEPVSELAMITDEIVDAGRQTQCRRAGGDHAVARALRFVLNWQELSALMHGGQPTPFEHFGFMDAIGDPIFAGQYPEGGGEVPPWAKVRWTGWATGVRSQPANSCWAGPTRRRKLLAPPCRSISAVTAVSSAIASCTSMWRRSRPG